MNIHIPVDFYSIKEKYPEKVEEVVQNLRAKYNNESAEWMMKWSPMSLTLDIESILRDEDYKFFINKDNEPWVWLFADRGKRYGGSSCFDYIPVEADAAMDLVEKAVQKEIHRIKSMNVSYDLKYEAMFELLKTYTTRDGISLPEFLNKYPA